MLLSFIDKKKNEIFFLILLLLFFYRSPYIFLNGRFMAEEGAIYFANAYKFGFFYSLIFVDFTSGYLNLWANISGIFSNLFNLSLAPLISNYLALIPKILIIFLILYCRSILFNRFEYKVLFCLLIFLSPQNVPEIWLNSINSQIFFCIIAFIIIFINYNQRNINYFHLSLIFFAGLTGIYSCILSPIFFFKYLIYKKKQDLLNFLVILSCAIIQLSLVIYGKLSNLTYAGKIHAINFDLFINYIYNVLVKVFLGTSLTKYIYFNYLDFNLTFLTSLVFFIFLVFIQFTYFILKKKVVLNVTNSFIILSSLYSLFVTSLVVMTGATGEYVGGRYAALPSIYLLCSILIIYNFLFGSKIKFLFLILLLFSIISGSIEYRPSKENTKHVYLKFLDCINCPNWHDEVDKFKNDNNYPLKIWPYPRKNMILN